MKNLAFVLILSVFAVTSYADELSDTSDFLNSATQPKQHQGIQSGDIPSTEVTDSGKTTMERKNEKLLVMARNLQFGAPFINLLASAEGQDENWRLSKGNVGTWIPMTKTTSDYTRPMVVYSVERIQFSDIPDQPIGDGGFWPSIPSHNFVRFVTMLRFGDDLDAGELTKRDVISDCSLTNSYGGHPSISRKNYPVLKYKVLFDYSGHDDFGYSREVTDIACYYAYGVTPPRVSKMPEFVRGLSLANSFPQNLQLSNKMRAQFMDESHKHVFFFWSTKDGREFFDSENMHVFMIDCVTKVFIGGFLASENGDPGDAAWREVPPTMAHPSDETFEATCAAATLPIVVTVNNSYDTSSPRGFKDFGSKGERLVASEVILKRGEFEAGRVRIVVNCNTTRMLIRNQGVWGPIATDADVVVKSCATPKGPVNTTPDGYPVLHL